MSVYKSTTLGDIALSFTGKHLLANEREAVAELMRKVQQRGYLTGDWEPLSLARGRIAQHMSKLEKRSGFTDEHGYANEAMHCLEALRGARDEQIHHEYNRRGLKPRVWDPCFVAVVPSFPGPLRIALEKVTTDELLAELKKRFEGLPVNVRCEPQLDVRMQSACIPPGLYERIKPFVEYGKKPKRKKKKLSAKKRSRR